MRWIIIFLMALYLTACGESPSNTIETSDIELSFDVYIDVANSETEIDAAVRDELGLLRTLSKGDQLVGYFGNEIFTFSKQSEGRYRATLPFVETGEYRIALERDSFVSAPNNILNIEKLAFVVAPQDGSIFSSNDLMKITWEVRNNAGIAGEAPIYGRWALNKASCVSTSGATIVEYEQSDHFRERIIVTDSFNNEYVIADSQTSNSIDLQNILSGLSELHTSDAPIQSCELGIVIFGGAATFSRDPNLGNFASDTYPISNSVGFTLNAMP